MRTFLLPFSFFVIARHGVNANGHLQPNKDIVINDIEGNELHLSDDMDHHNQRLLKSSNTPVNPVVFKEFMLNSARTPFVGQDADDTCGLTCRGPDQYAFGLLSCLRTAFETPEGEMPIVTIATSEVVGNIEQLPKVVFSPSTTLNNRDLDLDEYNSARRSWVTYSRLPSAILFAESNEDVVRGVNCARVNGYKVSPRGRGHDAAGLSSLEGSLVIDMQLNCKFDHFKANKTIEGDHILPGSKIVGTIKAPSGCTNAVFLTAVDEHFKDVHGMNVCGACPSVGITGYILNGGYGVTTPYVGTAADLVTEIEMVLYDGTPITASKDEYEDIFWASKGGTGGIGIITSFVARIIQNPSPTKKSTRFFITFESFTDNKSKTQLDTQVEILMRFQKLCYENPKGVLFGGTTVYNNKQYEISGTFLGSIDDLLTLFYDAELLDPTMLSTEGDSYAQGSDYKPICGGKTCIDKFDNRFPQFGLWALEFNTQAEAQANEICFAYFAQIDFFATARSFQICDDLGIDKSKYCVTDETTIYPVLKVNSCFDPDVIKAILAKSKEPQSFLNLKGPFKQLFGGPIDVLPNSLALGITAPGFGQGTGGFVIPPLQKKTIRNLLQIFDGNDKSTHLGVNHLIHGAPLEVPPESTGYPHRNAGWNLRQEGQSPEFINILLGDPAYQRDPINLQIYGNYGPSVRTPNYERHIYVDHAEKLSRIRTLYDPLGGFDSPRYVQRSRLTPRTVPQYKKPPKKSKKSKSEKNKIYVHRIAENEFF